MKLHFTFHSHLISLAEFRTAPKVEGEGKVTSPHLPRDWLMLTVLNVTSKSQHKHL